MDGEEGSGIRLSKRFAGGKVTGTGVAEVDYKTKAGTAWSHSFLNQKPWHPLSYPNQRRKWIAEQTHAQHERRSEEVAREYAQEQEFFRQTALISKKEKEKVEMMKAVSFMYVRPPGYNPESAKAAEIEDEMKREGTNSSQDPPQGGISDSTPKESMPGKDRTGEEKKKPRPRDVFGRPVATEEEFEILKNAPRLETGVTGRVKPFAVEVRNVKCLRCGSYGHQSGDRECPLKDAIMPNEESRLKRDDPLTAIVAHTDPSEPLKWELKQKPGLSPPRGGFKPDDPNQQIVAEDIFDEYGGFLAGDNIPELLSNFPSDKPRKKKSKSRRRKKHSSRTSDDDGSSSDSEGRETRSNKNKKHKKKRKRDYSDSYSSEDSDSDDHPGKGRNKHLDRFETFKSKNHDRRESSRQKHSFSSEDEYENKRESEKGRSKHSYVSEDDHEKRQRRKKRTDKPYVSSEDSDCSGGYKSKNRRSSRRSFSSENDSDKRHRSEKRKQKHSHVSEDSDADTNRRSRKSGQKDSYPSKSFPDRYRRSEKKETNILVHQTIQTGTCDRSGNRNRKHRHSHRH